MEDNILELITRHLKGINTPGEHHRLMRWLEASPENGRFYADFAANWNLHEALTSSTLNQDTERMVSRLNARIDAGIPAPRSRRRARILTGLSATAAVMCVIAGLFFFLRAPFKGAEHLETITNQTDDTSLMVLEDGTRVFLRPGATLSYNVLTLKGKRIANLSGDAYFDVSRDEEKPFLVKTGSLSVQVLGTAFSISASPEIFQVVLERGSVRLLSQEGEPMVSLMPNQKASWLPGGAGVRVEPVFASAFVTDKYKLVAFNDETVPEILKSLQDLFHVRLTCDRIPDGKRYNLAFLKSDSLENVVAILEYMTGTNCHIEYIY